MPGIENFRGKNWRNGSKSSKYFRGLIHILQRSMLNDV